MTALASAGKIGITTTVPIEAIYASGRIPVDLNNLFISGDNPNRDIEVAEQHGFPRSCCAWLKGLYGTIHRSGLRSIVGVTAGDCSETHALLEILESEGLDIIPFAFPHQDDPELCRHEIITFCNHLGVSLEAAEAMKVRLDAARQPAHAIDRLFSEGHDVSGSILFNALINCSDFEGDPQGHEAACRAMLTSVESAPVLAGSVRRIGLLGVPPIYSDLVETIEAKGARVIYHEVPRQFALPTLGHPLHESYSAYTYPFGAGKRIQDIRLAIEERKLDGLVHYVQSFCHRQLHDRLLREGLGVPLLTLEGDRPGLVDGAVKTRVEAFLEMLG